MNATIAALLCAPLLVASLAAQPTIQEDNPPKVGSRRPVDVSVEGLAESGAGPGSTIGVAPSPPKGPPFACVEAIIDQATGGCLTASSTPTLGMLYPYPGLNNVFGPSAFVGGGKQNFAPGVFATIGGGVYNTAGSYDWGATIGGGIFNTASAFSSTVAGGWFNDASGANSTVGGGADNAASGYSATVGGGGSYLGGNIASGRSATVGGGDYNTTSGYWSTVGGGLHNTASGRGATVAGGGGYYFLGYYFGYPLGNTASGDYATIPGGQRNGAAGKFSFAAGRRAKANHNGAFVWGDSFDGDKASSVANEFNVYASGGVRMFTNSAATTGVLLAPGGSTWTMVSDRNAKENIKPVDARAVLDKVAALPLATWNYKAQDGSIRHMGPMAQDFYAAFGLGLSDKTIDSIDPNGVALAAIQGLNAKLEKRLAKKDAEMDDLKAANKALLARVERLETLAQAATAK